MPVVEDKKVIVNSKAELIAQLEEAAKNEAKSEWMVSQDDVHFAVHMLDTHQMVHIIFLYRGSPLYFSCRFCEIFRNWPFI